MERTRRAPEKKDEAEAPADPSAPATAPAHAPTGPCLHAHCKARRMRDRGCELVELRNWAFGASGAGVLIVFLFSALTALGYAIGDPFPTGGMTYAVVFALVVLSLGLWASRAADRLEREG